MISDIKKIILYDLIVCRNFGVLGALCPEMNSGIFEVSRHVVSFSYNLHRALNAFTDGNINIIY